MTDSTAQTANGPRRWQLAGDWWDLETVRKFLRVGLRLGSPTLRESFGEGVFGAAVAGACWDVVEALDELQAELAFGGAGEG